MAEVPLDSRVQKSLGQYGNIGTGVEAHPLASAEFFLARYDLAKTDGSLRYEVTQANGLTFLTDPEKPELQPGEMAVYPYSDEATILLEMASAIKDVRGKPFSRVIDPYSGDGKSGLPIVHENIAARLFGRDINPRAVNLSQANAALNRLAPRSYFRVGDITKDGLPHSDSPGNTLYIANPPFALKAKGASMDKMRDGGENGLALTLVYASQAMQVAEPGDVIMGIGYSRIRPDDTVELQEELGKLTQEHGGKLTVALLQGQTLWRGFNGKKEQPNPMPITGQTFALKANPTNLEEVSAYQTAAQFHNNAGYNRLGYYGYAIQK